MFPIVKECPSCGGLNVIKINGIVYANFFESLEDWKLKKLFNCRKCKIELGLFTDNYGKKKLVWIDYFKCEDNFYNTLIKLQNSKLKYRKNNKKYNETLKKIEDVQNKIRLDQVKVKIKYKIQNARLMGRVY